MKELPKELVNPKWQLQEDNGHYFLYRNGSPQKCKSVDCEYCGTDCPMFHVHTITEFGELKGASVGLECEHISLSLDPETPIIGDEK